MATTIETGSGATPRMSSSENYASAMQAMVSAVGAKFDINEIVRLYTESNTASVGRDAGASAPRAGVPAIVEPSISMDDAALMIGELQSKLMDMLSQQQTGEIKSNQIDMKKKNAQQMEKVQKWLNDLQEAANKSKSAGIWGWVKSIFTAVASVVAAVVAVAASPFTGGASVLVAAIAIGAAIQSVGNLVMQGLEEAGVKIPEAVKAVFNGLTSLGGLIAAAAYVFGASEETRAWIQMGVDLVVGIATGVAAWRAVNAAASKGVEMVSKLSTSAQKMVVGADATEKTVSFAAGATEAGLRISAASSQRDADNALADKMAIMAQIQKLGMVMEQNIDDLKKIVDQMQSVFKIVADMVSGEADMKSQVNAAIGGRGPAV
jgi:hypothetical protein